jgi:hypothetical protein
VIKTETRFKAEGRGQRAEGGKRRKKEEGRRDIMELLTSNFTPSNFWYGIAIPLIT